MLSELTQLSHQPCWTSTGCVSCKFLKQKLYEYNCREFWAVVGLDQGTTRSLLEEGGMPHYVEASLVVFWWSCGVQWHTSGVQHLALLGTEQDCSQRQSCPHRLALMAVRMMAEMVAASRSTTSSTGPIWSSKRTVCRLRIWTVRFLYIHSAYSMNRTAMGAMTIPANCKQHQAG